MIISQTEEENYKVVNMECEISPCQYIYAAIIMQV